MGDTPQAVSAYPGCDQRLATEGPCSRMGGPGATSGPQHQGVEVSAGALWASVQLSQRGAQSARQAFPSCYPASPNP